MEREPVGSSLDHLLYLLPVLEQLLLASLQNQYNYFKVSFMNQKSHKEINPTGGCGLLNIRVETHWQSF